jgi:hypothetical protein
MPMKGSGTLRHARRKPSRLSTLVKRFAPERKVLSPYEKSEVGVKRIRDAVATVRASKAKASY